MVHSWIAKSKTLRRGVAMGKKSLAGNAGGCGGCKLMLGSPDITTGVAKVLCMAEKNGSWVKPRPISKKGKECQIERSFGQKISREQKSAEPRPENTERRQKPRTEKIKNQADNQILSTHYA